MKRNKIKAALSLLLIVVLLCTFVYADTSFTFTTPGDGSGTEQTTELTDKLQSIMQTIEENYYKDIDDKALMEGAIKGMFEVLDPHSNYFTQEEYQSFMRDIEGQLVGIGVTIEKTDNGITVVAPIEGTPAYKAGIKTGDIIVSVDSTDISGYTVEKASSIIRGEEGTKVKIGIKREGESKPVYYDIIREVININPVKYEIKPGNIGYIRITQFNENTAANMQTAVNAFKSKGVKGVVIDLRDNPGGLLDQVINACKLLIPKGPIVSIQTKTQTETYSSTLDKAPFKLVVLVNGGSASASEIMAGAIKDSKTGILVGEKTYGKGTVQNIWDGSDGEGYKITIAKYLTPSGFALDGIGLKPDVEVKYDPQEVANSFVPLKDDKSLKSDTVSLDVLAMQQRLKQLGYKITDNDGFFSTSTKAAVLKFQKDNKLKQDAVMDPADLKELVKKFNEKIQNADPQLDRAMTEIQKLIK